MILTANFCFREIKCPIVSFYVRSFSLESCSSRSCSIRVSSLDPIIVDISSDPITHCYFDNFPASLFYLGCRCLVAKYKRRKWLDKCYLRFSFLIHKSIRKSAEPIASYVYFDELLEEEKLGEKLGIHLSTPIRGNPFHSFHKFFSMSCPLRGAFLTELRC